MFKIGDKIVYPMYGAGIIDSIVETELDNDIDKHYIIRIPNGNLKIRVAVKKVEAIGVRPLSDEDTISQAIDKASKTPVVIQKNWNIRYKENLEKIKTGRLADVMEVARNLMLREREKGLSTAEKKMLHNAKQFVVSEIAYSKEIGQEKAEEYLAKRLLS